MDVFEAAYRVAHDFRGGAVALAKQLGKNPGTFLNEINPATETHKLGLADATLMQVVSGDHRILYAMGATLGEVCFPLPDLSNVSDAALIEHLTRIQTESGHFHQALHDALANDGRFDRSEYAHIQEEALQWIATIAEAVERVRGMVDE